ncbi:MAG: hypothetical protein LBB76_08995 [Azoarcus sp.]|nr:hypothetical protein [Azoarcus sp.]
MDFSPFAGKSGNRGTESETGCLWGGPLTARQTEMPAGKLDETDFPSRHAKASIACVLDEATYDKGIEVADKDFKAITLLD